LATANNDSPLVSKRLDLLAIRAAYRSGADTASSPSPASVRAKAGIDLPVLALVLTGTDSPVFRRCSANLTLLDRVALSTPLFLMISSRRVFSFCTPSDSIRSSSISLGSTNARIVQSIVCSCPCGNCVMSFSYIPLHISTSFLQYAPKATICSSDGSRTPSHDISPLAGKPRYSARHLSEYPDTFSPNTALASPTVSIQANGFTPYRQARIDPSNFALWATTTVFAQSTAQAHAAMMCVPPIQCVLSSSRKR